MVLGYVLGIFSKAISSLLDRVIEINASITDIQKDIAPLTRIKFNFKSHINAKEEEDLSKDLAFDGLLYKAA